MPGPRGDASLGLELEATAQTGVCSPRVTPETPGAGESMGEGSTPSLQACSQRAERGQAEQRKVLGPGEGKCHNTWCRHGAGFREIHRLQGYMAPPFCPFHQEAGKEPGHSMVVFQEGPPLPSPLPFYGARRELASHAVPTQGPAVPGAVLACQLPAPSALGEAEILSSGSLKEGEPGPRELVAWQP